MGLEFDWDCSKYMCIIMFFSYCWENDYFCLVLGFMMDEWKFLCLLFVMLDECCVFFKCLKIFWLYICCGFLSFFFYFGFYEFGFLIYDCFMGVINFDDDVYLLVILLLIFLFIWSDVVCFFFIYLFCLVLLLDNLG